MFDYRKNWGKVWKKENREKKMNKNKKDFLILESTFQYLKSIFFNVMFGYRKNWGKVWKKIEKKIKEK